MAQQFRVVFSRYKDGERRMSVVQHLPAESFAEMTRTANLMIMAMEQSDVDSTFDLASIEVVGFHGVICGGARMWETSEELTARVAKDKA